MFKLSERNGVEIPFRTVEEIRAAYKYSQNKRNPPAYQDRNPEQYTHRRLEIS